MEKGDKRLVEQENVIFVVQKIYTINAHKNKLISLPIKTK